MGQLEKRTPSGPRDLVARPIIAASRIVALCRQADGATALVRRWHARGIGDVLQFRAESVPAALALRAALPAEHQVRAAHAALVDALEEPSNPIFTEHAVASLLDSLGRKANANAATLLAAFSEVVGDDDTGEVFDLYPVLNASPVVIAFAVKRLRRQQIFVPAPAEFMAACKAVHERLVEASDELFAYTQLWQNIVEVIDAFGAPDQRGDAADPDAWLRDAEA